MTWVRLDDQWADHPKFLDVGDHGQLVWVKGLSYAARYLTDGFIPTKATPKFLRQPRHVPVAIRELVDAGLWVEVEGGYQVHDYKDYQPLAAKVKAEREATRARVQRWRERSSNGVTDTVTNAVTNGVGDALRAGARAGAGPGSGSGSDLVGVQGGLASESGFDLAWRVWSELWQAKYREPFRRSIDTGKNGDDRILQRLGALALENGSDAERVLRRKVTAYLATTTPWLTSNRHPLRVFEKDWNNYGAAPPEPIHYSDDGDDDAPSDAELDANRKRMDERTAKFAAERERRAKLDKGAR